MHAQRQRSRRTSAVFLRKSRWEDLICIWPRGNETEFEFTARTSPLKVILRFFSPRPVDFYLGGTEDAIHGF